MKILSFALASLQLAHPSAATPAELTRLSRGEADGAADAVGRRTRLQRPARRRAQQKGTENYDPYLGLDDEDIEHRRRMEGHTVGSMSMPAAPAMCSFCPDGIPDPDFTLPTADGATCGTAGAFAATLEDSDPMCTTVKLAEGLCCPPAAECSSIAEIASGNEAFSTLVAAASAAGLVDTLSGDGTFTVFAPPNSAFAKLPEELVTKLLDPVWQPQLQDVLLYHALGSEVFSTDLTDGLTAETLNFQGETITINLDPPRVNEDSNILVDAGLVDIEACNGVIHAVDTVLTPASVTNNIVDIAAGNDNFSTLVAAVTAAGLVDALSGEGPLTVFAPTNEAFAALPEGTVESLLLPENIDQLTAILTYHVVAANAVSSGLASGPVETLNGATVDVTVSDDGVMVGDSNVVVADIIASNGIIHVIDAVLLPPANLPEPEPETTTAATEAVEPTTLPEATDAPAVPATLPAIMTTEATEPVDVIVYTEAPGDAGWSGPADGPGAKSAKGAAFGAKSAKAKTHKDKTDSKTHKTYKEDPKAKAAKGSSSMPAEESSDDSKSGKALVDVDAKAKKVSGKGEKMDAKAGKLMKEEEMSMMGAKSGKASGGKAEKATEEGAVDGSWSGGTR